MADYKLYHGDCLDVMAGLPNESVDLVVTSPPYWNQREYSFWLTYQDYINSVQQWVVHVFALLKPGRHCFWVIPDKLPWPPKDNGGSERLYMPIYADTEHAASVAGFVCEYPIIWRKPHGTQKMFGSYPYPPTIIHTQVTERICVWRKPGKPDLSRKSEASLITKQQWVDWAVDTWDIQPKTNSNHPAPFPVEIPRRCITMWSFVGDTVLDPFLGSGTTGVVAGELKRDFIGIEKNLDYFNMAKSRVESVYLQLSLLDGFGK